MLPVGIGDAIRARRERAGLTQEALGALLGVHPNVIDDWEWGEGAPDPWQARRLAVILGLPERPLLARGPGAGDDASVLVLLMPPSVTTERTAAPVPRPSPPGLIPVPPRPSAPPPLPSLGATGVHPTIPRSAGRPGDRPGLRPARSGPSTSSRRFHQLVGAVAVALLVSVAAVSGVAAYRQGQLAAAREAEARALRNTLVAVAGERDRLAARIAELTAVLAEAGFISRDAAASVIP